MEETILKKLGEHDVEFKEVRKKLTDHDTEFKEIRKVLGEHGKQLDEQKTMLDILVEQSATKGDIKDVHEEIKDIRGEIKDVRSDITDLKTAIDMLTVTANTTLQELYAVNSNSKVHTNKNLEQDGRIEKCEENIVGIKSKLQMAI